MNCDNRKGISRRDFLCRGVLIGGAVTLGSPVINLAGCGSDDDGGPAAEADLRNGSDSGAVLMGLYPSSQIPDAEQAVRLACAELDWSWLTPGDTVFVKLACNSGNSHPAVTSPAAVRTVCSEILERGAGRVFAGDQAGVESVRLTAEMGQVGSTRELMEGNGLLEAIVQAGAEPHFFDEQGYEDGYVEATLDFGAPQWSEPPRIARIVTEVDHIVMLPRLSSHAITGCTLGHKCAVGWLRDDYRYLLHFNGGAIHQLYTEVNYCREIRNRLRLTLTLAEQVLLDRGPDAGTIAEADPRIVLASKHLSNHDAVGVAAMAFIDDLTPAAPWPPFRYSENADLGNQMLIRVLIPVKYGAPWGDRDMADYTLVEYSDYQQGIASDPALTRAYEILGGVPSTIPVRWVGEEPSSEFRSFLEGHNGGIFNPNG